MRCGFVHIFSKGMFEISGRIEDIGEKSLDRQTRDSRWVLPQVKVKKMVGIDKCCP